MCKLCKRDNIFLVASMTVCLLFDVRAPPGFHIACSCRADPSPAPSPAPAPAAFERERGCVGEDKPDVLKRVSINVEGTASLSRRDAANATCPNMHSNTLAHSFRSVPTRAIVKAQRSVLSVLPMLLLLPLLLLLSLKAPALLVEDNSVSSYSGEVSEFGGVRDTEM